MKNVRVEMSEEEFERFKKKKGKRTSRDILFKGVGMSPVPRVRGRPAKSDVKIALDRQHSARDEATKQFYRDQLKESNRRGLDPAISRRMLGDASPWTPIRCHGCGKKFETLEKRQTKCPACGRLVSVPRKPVVLGLPSEEVPQETSKEVPGYESQRTGNLSREIKLRESGTKTGGTA